MRLPVDEPPRLLVVIDTEEEFNWHAPYSRTNTGVSAMRHIERVQRIFDRFGIAPTYVVDYPVATQPEGYEPLREILDRGACTIGAHLHPWVNPPFDEAVNVRNSFTLNLPPKLQRAKIERLRDAIVEHFGISPHVFKAGRYGIGAATVEVVDALGFDTDCSVCPQFDFSREEGPSFSGFDSSPFFLTETLAEVPCTVDYVGWAGPLRQRLHRVAASSPLAHLRAVGVLGRIGATNQIMLSPEGNTLAEMQALTRALLARGQRLFTFSFHSPSVVPGHTPYVLTRRDLDQLLGTIEKFCEFFMGVAGGRPVTSPEMRTLMQSLVEARR